MESLVYHKFKIPVNTEIKRTVNVLKENVRLPEGNKPVNAQEKSALLKNNLNGTDMRYADIGTVKKSVVHYKGSPVGNERISLHLSEPVQR